jgi:YHS domain-containing protein
MRSALLLAAALLAIAAAGCDVRSAAPETPVPVQTIENAPPRLSATDPPPMLEERMMTAPAPPTQTDTAAETAAPPATTAPGAADELAAKTNLPFNPPIAMDPVDGSKVSITPATPVFSYKDRWYYFSSAANKAAFRANPEMYVKGSLSKY